MNEEWKEGRKKGGAAGKADQEPSLSNIVLKL
jgi:hypothetical protein